MSQIQLINNIVEWERGLEFEEERRKQHRYEPYVNYLATPQTIRKEGKSIFAKILRGGKKRQPARPGYREEGCHEAQPC
jgi:hypothetical protein